MGSASNVPRVIIIGSGFAGICMAIKLKQAGIDRFTILEKSDGLGGTWRDNVYPGAACDVPSFSYCYSFEQGTSWSRKWAPQAEILEYMEACARKYGIRPHVRLGTEVSQARFDEPSGVWQVTTAAGETLEAEVLVSAVGQLNRPAYPDIPGLDGFDGLTFHSARWRHDEDLTGKTVAVIGNAASAIQFIPQIAKTVGTLRIFQRSPNWMIRRGDREYGEGEKAMFAAFPFLARLYRWWIWARLEMRFPLFRRNKIFTRALTRIATEDMHSRVADPAMREALRPDYPVGAKRLLISDDYYEALGRDNVELITSPIERASPSGLVTTDGTEHGADAIILATGFESTRFLVPMKVHGTSEQSLDEAWSDGAHAYLGITVSGFPNFFMLYGPNTNLGHNSIIFMIECQVAYIMECIEALTTTHLQYLDVRPEVMAAYNAELQARLGRSVWAATGKSWYKTAAGKITNNWSSTTTRYWWKTRHVDFGAYRQNIREHEGEARPARAA